MKDAIFFISSALNPRTSRSIYNPQERYEQTLRTIESIETYCPNSEIFLFDSSVDKPSDEYFAGIINKGANILYTGNDPNVIQFTQYRLQSVVESISFVSSLSFIKSNNIKTKRIYKISGRYRLNSNFKKADEYVDKYVFTKPTKTWMTEDRIKQTGVDHVYQSRLYSFDYSLLDQFLSEMVNVINDECSLGIDIEHALYKNFKKYDPVELDIIGLCGNLAPNGESIDE